MCALSERLLQAAEHYSLSPLHAVSAAVAAYAVKEGREGGYDLFVFTPTSQKEE